MTAVGTESIERRDAVKVNLRYLVTIFISEVIGNVLVFSRAGVIDRTLLTLEFQSIACVSEARNVIFSKCTKRYFNSPYSACMCSCSCGLFHAP